LHFLGSRSIGLLMALFIAAAMAGAAADHAADPPSASTAQADCESRMIAADRECTVAGQVCARSRLANREYHRYGYHCGELDSVGRYHLVSR
jgi:hypothetical protein